MLVNNSGYKTFEILSELPNIWCQWTTLAMIQKLSHAPSEKIIYRSLGVEIFSIMANFA